MNSRFDPLLESTADAKAYAGEAGLSASVIIVNYNGGEYLQRCVGHLCAQTVTDFEVIVVDNGSHDGSLAHVPDDTRFRILDLGRNTGFAFANNRAVEVARSPWIALLNSDAFPAPDWLERLLHAAETSQEFSFFGSHQYLFEPPEHLKGQGDILDGTGDMLARNGLAWRRDHMVPADLAVCTSDEVFGACAAAALYDRAAFSEVGGFEESFFCYFEDVDLSFKLRLAGYRCLHVADAVVHHVGSASAGMSSEFQIYHGYRNLIWSFCKNMPIDLLLRNLPAFFLLLLRILITDGMHGRRTTLLKAYRDAIRGLPVVLIERRPAVQGLRRVSSAEIASHFGASRHFRELVSGIMFRRLARLRKLLARTVRRGQGAGQ
ncbi:MAG: glycosyltransferase family 2 protein [Alphaproteobacteria bacterium]|nr:glycosyltransferase family 2 protein [Alphaproteobacteria bacterium]